MFELGNLAVAFTLSVGYSALLFGLSKFVERKLFGPRWKWTPLFVLATGALSGLVVIPGILRIAVIVAEPAWTIDRVGLYAFLGVGAAAVGESAREQWTRWTDKG